MVQNSFAMMRTNCSVLAIMLVFGIIDGISTRADDKYVVQAAQLRTLYDGGRQAVFSMQFSADGKTLAGCGENHSLQVWDVATGKLRANSYQDQAANAWAESICITSDGKTAFVGVANRIQIWDTTIGKMTVDIPLYQKADENDVADTRLALHPEGKLIAATGKSKEIQVWDVTTRKRSNLLKVQTDVNAVIYSPDGKLLIGSGANRVYVWDVKTEKLIHEFQATLDKKNKTRTTDRSLVISRDARLLAFATEQSTISLWSLTAAKELGTFSGRLADFSVDGKHLFVQNEDAIDVIDLSTRKYVSKATTNGFTAHTMIMAPDGMALAIGYDHGRIILWDTTSLMPSK